MTTQRKVNIGLLSAAVGLIGWRLMSGDGPSSASAQPVEAGEPALARPLGSALPALAASQESHSLASRLKELDAAVPGADPFASPLLAKHVEAAPEPSAQDAEPAQPEVRVSAADFVAANRLTSLMVSTGGSTAVVNGKPMTVGGQVDDWTLINVGGASAVFEKAGVRAELTLR